MRIAVVTETWKPGGGGAERSAAQIVHELRQRGHEVTVLAGKAEAGEVEAGEAEAGVVVFPGGSMRGVFRLLRFGRWVGEKLDEGGFDASLSFTTAAAASVLQPRAGLVVEAQPRNVARRRSPGARLLRRLGLWLSPRAWVWRHVEGRTMRDPRVRRVVAISRFMQEGIERRYAVDPARVAVVLNAAEVEPAPPEVTQQWRRRIRDGLGIADEARVLLFLANDPERKGVEPLLDAVHVVVQGLKREGIAEEAMPVLLLVCPLRYRLHRRVVELDLRERVRFLGSTRRPDPLYAAADVTVLPSFYDPASKVVIESLRMGTPAITTTTNGSADWVLAPGDESPAGRVVADAADVDALAEAIREMLDDATLASCRRAAASIGEAADMRHHVDGLIPILEASSTEI